MYIRLKYSRTKEITIDGLNDYTKIKELKKTIVYQDENIHIPEAIHLVYQGMCLQNSESTLSKFQISDGDMISVIVNQPINQKTSLPTPTQAPHNIYQLVNQMIQTIPLDNNSSPSQITFTHQVSPELQEDLNTSPPPLVETNSENTVIDSIINTPIDSITSLLNSDSINNLLNYTQQQLNSDFGIGSSPINETQFFPANSDIDNLIIPSNDSSQTIDLNLPTPNNTTLGTTNVVSPTSTVESPIINFLAPTSTVESPTVITNPETSPSQGPTTEQYQLTLQSLIDQLTTHTRIHPTDTTTIPRASSFESNLTILENMGYTDKELNRLALESCYGSLNLAIDWLENLR